MLEVVKSKCFQDHYKIIIASREVVLFLKVSVYCYKFIQLKSGGIVKHFSFLGVSLKRITVSLLHGVNIHRKMICL